MGIHSLTLIISWTCMMFFFCPSCTPLYQESNTFIGEPGLNNLCRLRDELVRSYCYDGSIESSRGVMGPSEGLFSLLAGTLGHSRSVSIYDRRRLLYYVSV